MLFVYQRNNGQLVVFIWSLLTLVIDSTHSDQISQSYIVYYSNGTQYSPVNPAAQLLSTTTRNSLKLCAVACNQNRLCRIFDYDVSALDQCRLFEGDIDTVGSIIAVPSQSRVGVVKISAAVFSQYGLSCQTSCYETRYLTCSTNSTCECVPHTYWNISTSICAPQLPVIGASCQQNRSMCREDFGYTCLPSNQCGYATIGSSTLAITLQPNTSVLYNTTGLSDGCTSVGTSSSTTASTQVTTEVVTSDITSDPTDQLPIGVTIAGYDNMTAGDDAMGLNAPRGIFVSSINQTFYVCDSNNFRVQRFHFGSRLGTTVAGGLGYPQRNIIMNRIWNVVVDSSEYVYVTDRNLNRLTKWPPNITVNVTQGTIASRGIGVWGVAFDQYNNMYTSLFDTHVIIRNNNTIVIGYYNQSGNSSTYLNYPRGIFFDKTSSSLFVCDSMNHRIQKFQLNSSVGVTVAGGNGAGSNPNQLNQPYFVWVSPKNGDMYIADTNNNRIQRWKMNDTQATTVAGTGTAGSLPTMLRSPVGVALNANETFLYVSDQSNNRVQRFELDG
ncbi:unnamed protein product [Adineta ricciae]|uniref:Uncharacterized protein n=2 Tax=Adineta ricciae TaxID=249248 RepID=A0A815DUC3_ADIRI|nr:unnamed protein product [Adineta ricciae]